jgi:hypothetical protein
MLPQLNHNQEPHFLKYYIRRKLLISILGICFIQFLISCSHTTPYYQSEELKPTRLSIPNENIETRILLIGDSGEPRMEGEPVLFTLEKWASQIPYKTMVFFLGDNIYPEGLPDSSDPWRPEGVRRILAQLDALKNSGARGVFIPGNHDWAKGKPYGQKYLKNQEELVIQYLADKNSFLPKNGCPGPEVVDLDAVRVIILDTQWWLNEETRSSASCAHVEEDTILFELQKLIETTPPEKEVLVLAHHPLASHGPHGGFFTWKDHIFPLTNLVNWLYLPLPIIGSLYPLGRWNLIKNNQDLNGSLYKNMISQFKKTFSENPPLAYANGHDHNLQVLDGGELNMLFLVSGAGVKKKLNDVGHGDDTIFAHCHTGFMAIDFLKDGRALLRVVEPAEEEMVFYKWLVE